MKAILVKKIEKKMCVCLCFASSVLFMPVSSVLKLFFSHLSWLVNSSWPLSEFFAPTLSVAVTGRSVFYPGSAVGDFGAEYGLKSF